MSGKHRNMAERTRRVAVVTAATATATALTVGAAAPNPMPRPEEHYLRVVEQPVDLSASVSPFGPPGGRADITRGAGKSAYNNLQAFIESYERALAGINLAGGAGLNVGDLLSQIPMSFIDDILGVIPIDLGSVLRPILGNIVTPLLIDILDLLNITDSQGNITLSAVLGLVGLDLSDPLNLAGLNIPGVNIVTPGEPCSRCSPASTWVGPRARRTRSPPRSTRPRTWRSASSRCWTACWTWPATPSGRSRCSVP